MKKVIRYRIPISQRFPATHPMKGYLTEFVDKIQFGEKIHTIRANYSLWAKRFEKINKGEAVLELYIWTGKPYASKALTICQFAKNDGIGIQKLDCSDDYLYTVRIDGTRHSFSNKMIAKNDGLSDYDFEHWFKGYHLSQPLAIIHFTSFRY